MKSKGLIDESIKSFDIKGGQFSKRMSKIFILRPSYLSTNESEYWGVSTKTPGQLNQYGHHVGVLKQQF